MKNKHIAAISLTLIMVLLSTGSTFRQSNTNVETQTKKTFDKTETTTTIPVKVDETKKLNIEKWNKAVEKNNFIAWFNRLSEIDAAKKAEAEAARQAELAKQAAAKKEATSAVKSTKALPAGNGKCGGNLPPCCVMNRESGGSITAQNPTSSASGKWQFLNSTWGNYMGYPTAASAPEWVQDQRAAELWANGAGASHWGGGC